MARRNRSNARSLRAEEKAAKAYALRCHGRSFAAIAAELGFASPGAAFDAFSRGRAMLTREHVDAARDMMLERLDAMRAAVIPAAVKGHLQSIDTILKIDKREAELIGLEPKAPDVSEGYDAKASLKAKIELYMKRTGMMTSTESEDA